MILGHIIQRERLNKNMKQSYLAKGICSPSYLSKIENNSTEPSKEILDLIARKLEIDLNIIKKDVVNLKHEKENRQYLLEIYKEITINRSEKYARVILNELIELRISFSSRNDFYLYYLVSMRLLVVLKDNKTILEFLNPLMTDKERLNDYESYLLVKILGIYYFVENNIQESINNFEEALKISKLINLSSWEKTDLYYMYSLASLSNHQNINAIEYSEKSLKKFNENYQFERSIESLIIQGIAYKNSLNFKASMKSYEKAIEIIDKFQVYKFRALVFQNLGSLYLKLKEYKLALEYYLKSLNLKKNLDEKLITIFSIIQIYSRFKEYKDMNIWIQKGLEEISENNKYNHYIFHFNIYKLLGEDDEEKIELYLPMSIQYFEKVEDYRHAYKYCIKMALILQNKKKYKNSAIYYEKAFKYQNTMENITTWEDI